MVENLKLVVPRFISLYNETDLPDEEAWKTYSPRLSAVSAYKIFADPRLGLSGGSFTINRGGLDLDLNFSKDRMTAANLQVSLYNSKYVDLDKLFVFANKGGLGTDIFTTLLHHCATQEKEILVDADYELGPRFWGQMGFKMNEQYADTMRDKMLGRWNKIKPTIPEKDKDIVSLVDGLLANEWIAGYRMLWAIADITYPVNPLAENPDMLKKDENGKIPLSLAVLSGRSMSWKGSFNTRDSESMTRVENYLLMRDQRREK